MRKKLLVVKFKGGLGNQMFQYALYRKLQSTKNNVVADLSWYKEYEIDFALKKAFPLVVLDIHEAEEAAEKYRKSHKKRNLLCKILQKIYPELRYKMEEREEGTFQSKVLNYKRGILEGYWQTSKYWDDISDKIVQEYSFAKVNDIRASELLELISNNNSVSVHIRRGDYLAPENQELFGNICIKEYYEKAMSYIQKKVPDARFVFFSNDPQWVRDEFKEENAIYTDDYLNKEMPDWYDMYLMSQCKHHIIANSTFSWWGAYLGKNDNKIVIAPSKWINGKRMPDIYQDSWIKM